VKSIERYLGPDLVAFRLWEAQAERSYSSTAAHPSGFQPNLFTADESVEEKREWKTDPTAGIILTGTLLPAIFSLMPFCLFYNLHATILV
jgi:hypothetical protein